MQRLCRRWQVALSLRDWDVQLIAKKKPVLHGKYVAGWCNTTPGRRQATICIATAYGDGDIEQTIIHELLHCHFAPFDVPHDDAHAAEDLDREQAIDAIATALLRTARRRHPKESA